jgi:hypothetical protein
MPKAKDLTQRLAEQDQWKARNNLKTFNSSEVGNVVKFIFLSQEERRDVSKEYDWRVADWTDPNDYNAGEIKW